MEEEITITKAFFDSLLDDSATLDALDAAGVDNWEGYDVAMKIKNGEM